MHGGYWALVSGHPEACGVTVHLVDEGIDSGGILAQSVITPGPADCFVTYPLMQLGVGLPVAPRGFAADCGWREVESASPFRQIGIVESPNDVPILEKLVPVRG